MILTKLLDEIETIREEYISIFGIEKLISHNLVYDIDENDGEPVRFVIVPDIGWEACGAFAYVLSSKYNIGFVIESMNPDDVRLLQFLSGVGINIINSDRDMIESWAKEAFDITDMNEVEFRGFNRILKPDVLGISADEILQQYKSKNQSSNQKRRFTT